MNSALGVPRGGPQEYAEAVAAIENCRAAIQRRDSAAAAQYARLAVRRLEDI